MWKRSGAIKKNHFVVGILAKLKEYFFFYFLLYFEHEPLFIPLLLLAFGLRFLVYFSIFLCSLFDICFLFLLFDIYFFILFHFILLWTLWTPFYSLLNIDILFTFLFLLLLLLVYFFYSFNINFIHSFFFFFYFCYFFDFLSPFYRHESLIYSPVTLIFFFVRFWTLIFYLLLFKLESYVAFTSTASSISFTLF